jgi:tyrosyl-tRNA synthetase
MYKLAALTTVAHTQHAGAEVVKQAASPHMSNLLYPILQGLDEE